MDTFVRIVPVIFETDGRAMPDRMDHLLLSPAVASKLKNADIEWNIRSEPATSDHAPAWIELKGRPSRLNGPGEEEKAAAARLKARGGRDVSEAA